MGFLSSEWLVVLVYRIKTSYNNKSNAAAALDKIDFTTTTIAHAASVQVFSDSSIILSPASPILRARQRQRTSIRQSQTCFYCFQIMWRVGPPPRTMCKGKWREEAERMALDSLSVGVGEGLLTLSVQQTTVSPFTQSTTRNRPIHQL